MSRRADSKKPAPAPEARSRGPSPRSGGDAFVLTLFFMSGASGLIYEVLFSRVLHLQMGSTVYAITTVLTAFMGGLALGAFFAGKRASEIAHPVRAYAYCELLIGGFALAVPLLLWMLTPIFRLLYGAIYSTFLAWSMVTFVLCALVLLPPTILMGATLPILTEGLTRRGALVGRSAGKLYAVNTLGAFAGALLAGFVLIPNLGQIATLVVGVLINLSLFGLITRRYPAPVAGQPIAAAPPRSDEPSGFTDVAPAARTIVAAAYAANGFAAMLYQVGWTRATALSLGSSTYTFSIIVSAFIFGLAIGAMALARFVDRLRHPLQTFAILEIGVGVSATLVLPIFGKLPIYAYDVIFKYQGSFGKLVLMELLMLFGLVAVPTLLMGALFPLSTSILRGSGSGSRAVGVTYAVNTIGTILGAFTMGFFLIPYLGVEKSLLLASACNVAFGCLALAWPWPPTLVRGTAIAVLLVLLYPAHQMLPPWDKLLMTSGPYLLDPQFQKIMKQIEGGAGPQEKDQIVYFKDDPNVNVAVLKVGDGLSLKLNGKADASTFQDMATQRLVAYLPMFLHGHPKNVCVIGMGSGVSGGCVSVYPTVESVDLIEIARSVIDAGRFFRHVNHDVLESKKVTFIEGDGRVHLRLTRKTYDVIVSEPSNPWIAGIGSLFTVDYFRETRRRLADGGVMAAWVQTYRMSRQGLFTVLRSFHAAYPNMVVWTAAPGDLLLVGSASDLKLDLDAARKAIGTPEMKDDMDALLVEEPIDLLSHLCLTPKDVERVTAEGTRVNTDNNGWLEFHAPRALYAQENVLKASEALSIVGASELPIKLSGSDAEVKAVVDRLPDVFRAKRRALEAEDAMEEARQPADLLRSERLARESLSMNAREHQGTMVLSQVISIMTRELIDQSKYPEALPKLEELARINPSYPYLAFHLSEAYMRTQRFDAAMPWLDKLKAEHADDPALLYNRGLALMSIGRPRDAIEDLEAAIKATPTDAEAYLALGNAYLALKDYPKAIEAYDHATMLKPAYYEAQFNRGNALWGKGDLDGALLAFSETRAAHPQEASIIFAVANLYLAKKDGAKALETIAPVLAQKPDLAPARLVRGQALLLEGNAADALADFEPIAAAQPKALVVQLALGDALQKLGRASEAQEAYARASAIDPEKTQKHLAEIAASGS